MKVATEVIKICKEW